MLKFARFWFILAISAIVGWLYALPFALLLHGLLGNPTAVIEQDVRTSFAGFMGITCFSLTIMFVLINIHLLVRRDIYRRNHDATKLAHKARGGFMINQLSEEERRRFHWYREDGVLTHNSHGQLRISDRAMTELWG